MSVLPLQGVSHTHVANPGKRTMESSASKSFLIVNNLFFFPQLPHLMELDQDRAIETTFDWCCLFLVCSFASFLKQPGFESKALNEPDPAVHSPFAKVVLICIPNLNKNCPKCSNAEQSRLFSEKQQFPFLFQIPSEKKKMLAYGKKALNILYPWGSVALVYFLYSLMFKISSVRQ